MHTADLATEKLAKLVELFQNAITEIIDLGIPLSALKSQGISRVPR